MSTSTIPLGTIFIIRHGEKPPDPPATPPPYSCHADGSPDPGLHSLIPLGWQRAGALAALFDPEDGQFRAGLARPTRLIAPKYAKEPENERTHQTIQPLANRLRKPIETPYEEGEEKDLGKDLAKPPHKGITLVCWEHKKLHVIADHICPKGTPIPGKDKWPGKRFDVVWRCAPDPATGVYAFDQIPQMLLAGDSSDPIAT